MNGDGFDDLIVGAWGDDPNGIESGARFVVFGGDFLGAATQVGATGDDTLTGSAARDVLAVSDLGFDRVQGGNGVDTLRLDGSGLTLDLAAIDGTSLSGIERIDLGTGGNRLLVDRQELLNLSDESNTVRVIGTAGEVSFAGTSGWSAVGAVTDAEGMFEVFTNGRARLEILSGVTLVDIPMAPIELAEVQLDSDARGFVINGVAEDDFSGRSVSSAGDVNGDGLDDLIVGVWGDDPNDNFLSGASFVVFGKTGGTAVALSDVQGGTGGFVINGVAVNDRSGISVSAAGDVNGDGFDDLIVGAFYDDPNGDSSSASFVVFGKTDDAVVQLSDV